MTQPPPPEWVIEFRDLAEDLWARRDHLLFEDRELALRTAVRFVLGRGGGYFFTQCVRVVPRDHPEHQRYLPGSEDLKWPPPDDWR